MKTLCICTRTDSLFVRRPVRSVPKNDLWSVWLLLFILFDLIRNGNMFLLLG